LIFAEFYFYLLSIKSSAASPPRSEGGLRPPSPPRSATLAPVRCCSLGRFALLWGLPPRSAISLVPFANAHYSASAFARGLISPLFSAAAKKENLHCFASFGSLFRFAQHPPSLRFTMKHLCGFLLIRKRKSAEKKAVNFFNQSYFIHSPPLDRE